jgi:hypothetical protein
LLCTLYVFVSFFSSCTLCNWSLGCWVGTQINKNFNELLLLLCTSSSFTDHGGRAVWGVGRLRPLECWDRGFGSRSGHGRQCAFILCLCVSVLPLSGESGWNLSKIRIYISETNFHTLIRFMSSERKTERYGPLKKMSVALKRHSSEVHANQFVLLPCSYKCHVQQRMMCYTKGSS